MSETKTKVNYLILDVTVERMAVLCAKTHRGPGALIDRLVELAYAGTEGSTALDVEEKLKLVLADAVQS